MTATYRYDPTAFKQVFEHNFTYIAGVERNRQRFANRPALHDPLTGRRWTYEQLWEDSGKLAAGLVAKSVGPGDVVAFQLFNCPERYRFLPGRTRQRTHPRRGHRPTSGGLPNGDQPTCSVAW